MKNIISETELKRMVKKVAREEKLNKINESYDNHMGGSIFDDIESDMMEMSKDEALDYLDEIINFCINKQEDLGYDTYMSDFVNKTYNEYKEGKISKEDLKSLIPHLERNEKEELLNLLRSEKNVNEEGEKWIQKAIKKPGSLRRKMGKKEGEKITSTDIKNKLASLRAKDEDPTKKGVQGLGKSDLKTYRQLNLAKTLRGL